MSRILTVAQLKEKNACQEQVDLFVSLFGDQVKITKRLCVKHYDQFDWRWAADNLLSVAALAEYDKACDVAWAEYNKARVAARAEYDKVCAAAGAAYHKVCDAAGAEYYKVCAAASAEYYKVCAAVWAKLYIKDK